MKGAPLWFGWSKVGFAIDLGVNVRYLLLFLTSKVVTTASTTVSRKFLLKIEKRTVDFVEHVEADYLLIVSGSSKQALVKTKTSVLAGGDCMQSNNSDVLQAVSTIRRNYSTKLEQVMYMEYLEVAFGIQQQQQIGDSLGTSIYVYIEVAFGMQMNGSSFRECMYIFLETNECHKFCIQCCLWRL